LTRYSVTAWTDTGAIYGGGWVFAESVDAALSLYLDDQQERRADDCDRIASIEAKGT